MVYGSILTGHAPRSVDYTYDEHGNMLTMPHLQSMHYDYQDQLNKVVLDASGNTAYYIYDAVGQRVRKVVEKAGGIKEERYYLGNYEVYRKFVGVTLETERTTAALTDDKRKIATIDKLTVEERSLITLPLAVIRYQFDNHLGSASLELDATAQIISYEEYHPFGTTSYRSGRSETEVSLKRYKYVGKERDEETGLYYYGFRYYAAWIARFINVDPLQHEYPHYTPFQYAGNTPISAIDLDGLEPLFVITGITTHKSDEKNAGHKRGSYYLYKVEVYENMTIGEYRELYDKGLLQRPDAVGFLARDAWNKSKRGENRYSTNNELPPGEGYLNYWPENSPGRFRLYFGAEKKGSKNRTIINGVSVANDRVVFGPDGPRGGIAVHQWSPHDAEGCLTTGYGNQDSENNFFKLSKSLKEFEFGFYIVEERKVFFHNSTKSWRGVENTTRPLPQWILDIYNDEDLILKPDNTATQTPLVYEKD